jgi:hypothetical protein
MAKTAEKGTPLEPQVKGVEIEVSAPAKPSQPNLAQIKKQVAQLMMESGIDAQQMITIGQMAEKSISDPALFQMFKQQAIANEMADEEDLSSQNKYKFLAAVATLGKMAEQMVKTGELKG